MTKPIMIEADDLTKVYGGFEAVKRISFTCRQGEIVGFLGPNGAGKTTTMRLLTGYMPPTSGEAFIAGYHTLNDSIPAREHLGYLPETVPLYNEMQVDEYLAFVGRLREVDNLWERVDYALESVDLLSRAENYIGTLSKGMKQRVGLAQAILHDPDVLILDEPTIGLDPRQIADVRDLIKELGQRHTILLSTHILSEVEQICDRVIMIINGRLKADMSIGEAIGRDNLQIRLARPDDGVAARLTAVDGVHGITPAGNNRFTLLVDGEDQTQQQVAETCVSAGWGLLEMRLETISLESVFLDKLRDEEAGAVSDELLEVADA